MSQLRQGWGMHPSSTFLCYWGPQGVGWGPPTLVRADLPDSVADSTAHFVQTPSLLLDILYRFNLQESPLFVVTGPGIVCIIPSKFNS